MREKATGDVHWFIAVCIAALGGYLHGERGEGWGRAWKERDEDTMKEERKERENKED